MNTEDFKRKLAAIFSADVAGYSRLMGEDEMATVSTITLYREVMSTLIKQHRGRLVDSPGDNVLAEFGSVVDAAQCAVAVQKEFQSRNSELPEERRMQFRIGINLGDVIEEGERIYGDGVNIAARLEALADPGGICISKTAFDHIESKLPLGYEYIGEHTVKNITKPVYAYKVIMDPRVIISADTRNNRGKSLMSKKPVITVGIGVVVIVALLVGYFLLRSSGPQTGQGPDERPSIAILPFKNMSGDPEQEHFSDGITEELINALAKVKGLRVVSQTSTFYFKDKNIDLHTVGEKLNVDHVLEGSVRKSENKLRITAQLINVDTDTHLWSETYDREMKDIFTIQDEISLAVATQLKVTLLGPEEKSPIGNYVAKLDHGLREYDTRFGITLNIDEEEIITDGLFACAFDLVMAGSVKGGLRAYGSSVVISGNSQDAVDFGGARVTLSGHFQDNVKGTAVTLVISGTFEKNVEVRANNIIIEPTAVIKGNLAYSAESFDRREESQILGELTQLDTEAWEAWLQDASEKGEKVTSGFNSFFWIMSIILILIVGVIVNFFFPKQKEAIVSTISKTPGKSIAIGILSLIVVPLVMTVFCITVIGIPLAILTALLYILALYIGRIYVGLWVGRKVLGNLRASFSKAFFWPFAAGTIIIGLLSLIPIFGWIFKYGLMLMGAGAMWLVIWRAYRAENRAVEGEAEA
jgi:TolB-like protein/class 3 adenylate cyclase